MKNNYRLLGAGLFLVSACVPKSESRLKETWNAANNPVKMMAEKNEFETNFAKLPTSGRPSKMPWSDHYWPTYHGGIAYRWDDAKTKQLSQLVYNSTDRKFAGQLDNDVQLQKARSEVLGFNPYTKEQLEAMDKDQRSKLISTLSPAEKLDIYRGAFDYPTVKSERERTEILSTLRTLPNAEGTGFNPNPEYKEGNKIPTWFGICHAWAPATILFEEPGPLTVQSTDGYEIRWAASDIKALLSHAIDVDSSQQRTNDFMAERCNNDMSASAQKQLLELVDGLEMGKLASIEKQVNALVELRLYDYPTNLAIASYFYNYAPTQEEAKLGFQKLFERFQDRFDPNSSTRQKLKVAYANSLTHFPKAGKPEELDRKKLKEDLVKEAEIPACNDTNAGAFHLVLTNMMGIQQKSFGVDVTRDTEVWNQAAADYSSRVMKTFTGNQISAGAALGTDKELLIETRFRYTTEDGPGWNRFGDNVHLQKHHVSAGDVVPGIDANRDGDTNDEGDTPAYKAYIYRIELDVSGNIIGGSWVSKERPDFLWGTGNFMFSSEFSDIQELYYESI